MKQEYEMRFPVIHNLPIFLSIVGSYFKMDNNLVKEIERNATKLLLSPLTSEEVKELKEKLENIVEYKITPTTNHEEENQ